MVNLEDIRLATMPYPEETPDVGGPLRATGSLTMLAADGSGASYSRRWTLAEPVFGNLWTISGGTATLSPERLNTASNGRYVTLRIEVADRRATHIDGATLHMIVNGRPIPAETHPAPALVFDDGDQNPETEAKFDRKSLHDALPAGAREVPVPIRWRQLDGTPGAASTIVRTS